MTATPSEKATATPRPVALLSQDAAGPKAREDVGRSVREAMPRSELGVFDGPRERDPVALTAEQERTLIPELVPIRNYLMAASPFAFLRGSAGLMALDLAAHRASGIAVQLCGDAHLSNFGAHATPERKLVFDVADFDETHAGPFEWDVKRLATSAAVAARAQRARVRAQPKKLGALGRFDEEYERRVAQAAAEEYRLTTRRLASTPYLDVWYHEVEVDELFGRLQRGRPARLRAELEQDRAWVLRQALHSTSLSELGKSAAKQDGRWQIVEAADKVVHVPGETVARVKGILARYARSLQPDHHVLLDHFEVADVARKVVGVGSVGTQAYAVLLMGPQDEPLFLQLKEARPSALEPFVEGPAILAAERIRHQGERVVTGQRLLQAAPDTFLGWTETGGHPRRQLYVRQLRDWKVSAKIEVMDEDILEAYARACGQALARAHARGGSGRVIAGYMGRSDAFEKAIASFALRYSDQNDADHDAMTRGIASGRLVARKPATP